jgi:putative transposase
MPRPPRFILPGFPHHVTQRGNYRQEIFIRDQDRRLYLELLWEFSLSCGVAIQAYCLMSNHVHLIGIERIREATAHGWHLGNDEFLQ